MIDSPEPYADPLEHLSDELRRWEIRLELEALRMNAAPPGDQPLNEVPGLFVSASEARSLTDAGTADAIGLAYSFDQADRLKELDARLRARLEKTEGRGAALPLYRIRDGFGLGEIGFRCLLALAAPHADRRFDKLYRYLQEDYGSPSLSIDLLLRICCDDAAQRRLLLALLTEPASPMRELLVAASPADGEPPASLLAGAVRLRKRVVRELLGLAGEERGALARVRAYRASSAGDLPPPLVNGELLRRACACARRAADRDGATALLAYGPSGSGKTFLARRACAELGKTLLEWDLRDAPEGEEAFLDAVDRLLLEARLQDAVPAFDRLHALRRPAVEAGAADRRLEKLLERLDAWRGPLFLLGEEETRTPVPPTAASLIVVPIALEAPDIGERRLLWEKLSEVAAIALPPEDAGLLAGRFLFTPGQIETAIREARKAAEWRIQDSGEKDVPALELLQREAYRMIDHRLKDKAAKLAPRFGWDDLILPPDTQLLLRRACDRVRFRHTVLHEWGFESKLPYGKGTSMLFTGPPGTGKTMAAMVMAREMSAELYRVDLSRVVSKYIGETEKNLGDIFDEARRSGAILFFDEADALFGKRSEVKDAHDKYANMETSYLLQKMEEYDGLTILASNFSQNLDDAFARRIPFIVKFPFPDAVQRERLWRSALPRQMPALELDFPFLAQAFELAGGPIKNIVVTAAFLAASEGVPVSMKQIVEGVVQEYKKTGKVLLKDRLGAYADYGKG